MAIDVDGIIHLLNLIAQEETVKTTVKESLKGSLLAGVGAFLGGLMGGPVGLVMGGVVGTGFGYAATKDNFVSLPMAIECLPYERKERIAYHIQDVIDNLDAGDLATLTQLAAAVTMGGAQAVMQHHVLRQILTSGVDYVRTQITEEATINPGFMSTMNR